jgi:membrane protease YdiL (CAAX protease family)
LADNDLGFGLPVRGSAALLKMDARDRAAASMTQSAAPDRRPWGVWASLAWYVLIYEIVWRAYVSLWTFTGLEKLEEKSAFLHVVDVVLSWNLSLLIIVLAVRLTRIPLFEYLGWTRPRASDVALGVVVTLAVPELLDMLTGTLLASVTEYRAAVAAGTSPWWYVLQWWPAMIFAPVVEESFFRGFLWHGVQFRLGNVVALLVTTLMFFWIHDSYWYHDGSVDWREAVQCVAFGLIFGWLRWRSGGTTVPMIAHAAFNALTDAITVAISALLP